jgi:hypothetical protein
MPLEPREKALRQRLKDEFPFYAEHCLSIRTKEGRIARLKLNDAQRHLHAALERQRTETGRVRALVLKGRQQGCSTYVEARFFWQVSHRKGVSAYILTHLEDATNHLFGITKRFFAYCPPPMRPSHKASNAKELIFDRLDSGFRVGTAGGRGAGRGETIQYFHGSEVAFWPHAETHVAGALQAVPDAPGTEVILESTSAGRQGVFYEMCQAARRGEGEYRFIFIPWFWQREYRKNPPAGFTPTSEEEAYAADHGVELAQLAWRRTKLVELGGAYRFRREYPATPEEAFAADNPGALWSRALIEACRVNAVPAMKRIVVGIDPSGGSGRRNAEVGLVVAGLGADGIAYVLEDASARLGPAAWGNKAIALHRRHRADRLVAERNFGGDMVAHVLRTVDAAAPIKLVTASRGKAARAEPIAALYEQGKVRHLGAHIALEDEMAGWDPLSDTAPSPNRVDALVWALTELMLEAGDTGLIDYYATLARRHRRNSGETPAATDAERDTRIESASEGGE